MFVVPLCPVSGKPMERDIRPFTIAFQGRETTVALPGWYSDACSESIHSRDDLTISDHARASLKAEAEWPGPAR